MQKHFNNEALFYKYSWFYNLNLMKICAGLKQIVSQCFCTAHLNSTQWLAGAEGLAGALTDLDMF